MKYFPKEEIEASLKDESAKMTVAASLFMKDLNQIAQDLRARNGNALGQLISSALRPEAVKRLEDKNIIEDGELTNLGLAHVHVFLLEEQQMKQWGLMEPGVVTLADMEKKKAEFENHEMRALVYLSLFKFSIEEITELFNERQEKVLTYYLVKPLNDEGLNKMLEYKIITLQNTITDLGWKIIEDYIRLTNEANKRKAAPATVTVAEANVTPAPGSVEEPAVEQKKWWQFWK